MDVRLDLCMERVDLHGIRPVDKRTVGSIQFSAKK